MNKAREEAERDKLQQARSQGNKHLNTDKARERGNKAQQKAILSKKKVEMEEKLTKLSIAHNLKELDKKRTEMALEKDFEKNDQAISNGKSLVL